jgi:alpha-tubulin suppressor-like RCC1 family protein
LATVLATLAALLAGLLVGSVGAAQASIVQAGTTSPPHVGGYPLAAGGSFVPLPQQRILDSRTGSPASSYTVDVSPYLPPGTMSATVDITVLSPARSGYLLSVPDLGYQKSPAATLTFLAHRTVTGLNIATLTDRDTFLLQLSSPAQVLVDLTGYFTSRATTTATGSYHAVAPHRIADSRSRWGLQPIGPGGTQPVTVVGGTVPAGVSAVMVNLVEVGATAGGYLTAYPYGQAQPHVASISFARGKTVAERAIVAVQDGKIAVFNAAGTTQLVVEIVGYFAGSDGSLYHAIVDRYGSPTARVADTRIASDPDQGLHSGALTIDETLLDIASKDLPRFTSTIAVTSVLATVSAVSPRGFGGVAAYSAGSPHPAVSDLVYTADGPVTNLISPTVSSRIGFTVRLTGSASAVVVDLVGYFVAPRAPTVGGTWAWGLDVVTAVHPYAGFSSAPEATELGPAIGYGSGGEQSMFLIRPDHTVWSWGSGSLAHGANPDLYNAVPRQIPGLTAIRQVATAPGTTRPTVGTWESSYALRDDGVVFAWGQNDLGQLGDGNTTFRSTPAPVPGLTGVVQLATDLETAFALKSDGTVWGWGDDREGQLDDGAITPYSAVPVQIPGMTGIVSISDTQRSLTGVTGSGSIIAPGKTQRSVPCPARQAWTDWNNAWTVLCTDGTVWLSDLSLGESSNPVPGILSGLAGVSSLVHGSSFFALRTDGAVWTWGTNYSFTAGDGWQTSSSYLARQNVGGTSTSYWAAAPFQVPGMTGVTALGATLLDTFVTRG